MNNTNNKISNQKVEVPTGLELNEKDYLNCLLTTLKDMGKNYAMAMSEASNEQLYNVHKDVFILVNDLQRDVYELMFRKGWYSVEKVAMDKVTEKENMLNQEYQELELEG